jgi:hypothetical protein
VTGRRCDSISIFNTSIVDLSVLDPETASIAVQELQMCSRECYIRPEAIATTSAQTPSAPSPRPSPPSTRAWRRAASLVQRSRFPQVRMTPSLLLWPAARAATASASALAQPKRGVVAAAPRPAACMLLPPDQSAPGFHAAGGSAKPRR